MVQTVSLIGTYFPRQCGIGTFGKDLRDAIAQEIGSANASVLAIDDMHQVYDYPDEVRFQVPMHSPSQYQTAADLLNINQTDVALVQHEYGIYGGTDGSYVLDLVRRLRMPAITTLHTVLSEPSPGQRAVMVDLALLSDRLVVMSHLAKDILRDVYGISPRKVAFIPHGIPDVPFTDPSFFKDQFALEGRTAMLTFGLLSPGKGLEVGIRAMAEIVKRHPEVVYLILGATHPNVLKREGEAYRHYLQRLADRLHLRSHVMFHNRFVTLDELCRYIAAADIFVTPYPNLQQIVSGTLAYAVGAGKAVVSTPYWYAKEMLDQGRGRLFEPGDCAGMAQVVTELLDNEVERQAMRKRAYLHGRSMIWKEVARDYLQLAGQVLSQRARSPRTVHFFRPAQIDTTAIPELDLTHLRRLTDSTGIMQHAVYVVPDRHMGYCTDDNARALVAVMLAYEANPDASLLPLAYTYMAFVHHAFNPEVGRFRNFMTFDRRWVEEAGGEDVQGRAILALGKATALAPNDAILSFSTRLFNGVIEEALKLGSPRAWAFSLMGIDGYLQRFAGDMQARRVRDELAGRLLHQFETNSAPNWPWCEDSLTYSNGKLPHALILSGQALGNQAMLDQGLHSLEWLLGLQLRSDGNVSMIGNDGWMLRTGQRARFDQQPIEAMAMIEACATAYRVTTQSVWLDRARQLLGWFIGNNDTQSSLYDYSTGGCRDGLHADGPNLNQGAESTLAWLISLLTVMNLNRGPGLIVAENLENGEHQPVPEREIQAVDNE